MRLEPIDNLNTLYLASASKQVGQHAVERQCGQFALFQLGHDNLLDEASVRVALWIGIVKAIDVFDEGMGRAAVALGEKVGTGVGAVGWDAPHARRMLP